MRTGKSASYPRGVSPTARRYAMSMQLALLGRALAPWPRRQAPLLEVNCGNGAFLPFLWQCGFDAQGVESDPALRAKARKRAVPGLEIHAGQDDDLPFENDSYDWVIIHLKAGGSENIKNCAGEGARLARRGIMLTFWNSASLPALCWQLARKKPWAANSASWHLVWRQMRKIHPGRLALFSTLAAPACAWRGAPARVFLNFPIGSWCAIRLDMGETAVGTSLPLRLGASLRTAEPVMEYAPKRANVSKKSEIRT